MRITWKQIVLFAFPILIVGCIGHPFCEITEDDDEGREIRFVEVGVADYPDPDEVIVDPPRKIVRQVADADAGSRHW